MSTPTFGFPFPGPTDSVRDGWENIRDLAEATDGYLSGGFVYAGTRYFTADGNFEKADPFDDGNPSGLVVRAIRVRVVGAGGGGGGALATGAGQSSTGGGGGGGGYAEAFVTDIAGLNTSVSVTRGAGGGGGSSGTGGTGGTSSFGSLVVATGGVGGGVRIDSSFPRFSLGGLPGVGTAGDFVASGNGGTVGGHYSVSEGGVGQHGGSGGGSFFGGGGTQRLTNATGQSGSNGGGGAGGAQRQNAAAVNGGAGGNGVVIVDIFV